MDDLVKHRLRTADDRKRYTRVYLDNCCYSRLFDDRSIIKNYLEREAVILIMEKAFSLDIEIIGSQALAIELMRNKDVPKRNDIVGIYEGIIIKEIKAEDWVLQRAEEIRKLSNIRLFDSIHLAIAEQYADVLVTTDIKFLNAAKRLNIKVAVKNPIEFILEGSYYDTDN